MDDRQEGINRGMLAAFESLAKIAQSDQELHALFGRGFHALTLQADRYDAELAEIRDGLAALDYRLRALEPDGREHSTIVRPFRCVPDESAGLADTTGNE